MTYNRCLENHADVNTIVSIAERSRGMCGNIRWRGTELLTLLFAIHSDEGLDILDMVVST